jgi:hypothetical protein
MDDDGIVRVGCRAVAKTILNQSSHDIGKGNTVESFLNMITRFGGRRDDGLFTDRIQFEIETTSTRFDNGPKIAEIDEIVLVFSATTTIVGSFNIIVEESILTVGVGRIDTMKGRIDLWIQFVYVTTLF